MQQVSQQTVYRRKDMLSVSQVCKEIPGINGGPCSRQHVYNLIDRGLLKPAFRFGRRQGMFVPREAVHRYVKSCEFDPNL
ncbi:MAG: helix-turn-helix domain-containing protein [Desulfofustis sp.]|nr:helix-turn-helix domain-containing protein [Desulfofustis sp.]